MNKTIEKKTCIFPVLFIACQATSFGIFRKKNMRLFSVSPHQFFLAKLIKNLDYKPETFNFQFISNVTVQS